MSTTRAPGVAQPVVVDFCKLVRRDLILRFTCVDVQSSAIIDANDDGRVKNNWPSLYTFCIDFSSTNFFIYQHSIYSNGN
jgi:hypothetical protein